MDKVTIHKKFNVGDIVKPGRKKNPGWGELPTYSTLNYDSTYRVTQVCDRPSGFQSVMLEPAKKGKGHSLNHDATGRFYASDNLELIEKTSKSPVHVDQPNLFEAVVGHFDITKTVRDKTATAKQITPTTLVIDLKTGSIVFSEEKERSFFVEGSANYDKTKTGADNFVQEALKKDPYGQFAVYQLAKVGKVSEIKVKWE